MLGEHKLTRFSSTQLEALVQMHCADVMNQCIQAGQHFETADAGEDQEMANISAWRANLIQGALRGKATKAHEIEKVIQNVYTLDWEQKVDMELLDTLTQRGFSRIPVYYGEKDRNFIVGVLMLKSLVKINVREDEEPKTLG